MIRRYTITPVLLALVLLATPLAASAAADTSASQEALAAYKEALAKWEAGRAVEAEQGFRRAAEIAPRWGAPNARLGAIYQLQGKEQEARAQYALTQAVSFGDDGDRLSGLAASQRTDMVALEALIVYLVNNARLAEGQPMLVPDPTVAIVARRHSEEMRDKNYFDHNSPTRGLTTAQDRFLAVFGYKPRCVGENVSRRWGTLYSLCEDKMRKTHLDLMNSPGHRHNILYPSFEWLGVGIAANTQGDYWMTEVFVEDLR